MKGITTARAREFEDRTPLLNKLAELQRAAQEDGFLFFRDFLPREPVLELRHQILEIVERHGWLKKGTDSADGIADLEAIAATDLCDESLGQIGVTHDAYREIQCLELFHSLPHHPKLIALYEMLFGAAVLPHPRHIARVLLPAPSLAATPPHQDYIYIQGTHNFWTCWFPLGDCPVALGGLSVLRGSHREEVLDVRDAPGAGGKEAILCGGDYEWVQGDYRCGDIITFPSHLVHKGLPNRLSDRIRLSCDLRYQPAHEGIEEKSLLPHFNVAPWDEIYRGWKSDKLQYYWNAKALNISPWENSLLQAKKKLS